MVFCPNCGKELTEPVPAFCPHCGNPISLTPTPPSPKPAATIPQKNAGIAAVLALGLGIFGFMGVGHLYVGKILRGICLLAVGLILGGLTWGSFILGFLTFGIGFVGFILFGLILFSLWIWQIYNAYSLANRYNEYVKLHGTAPW